MTASVDSPQEIKMLLLRRFLCDYVALVHMIRRILALNNQKRTSVTDKGNHITQRLSIVATNKMTLY